MKLGRSISRKNTSTRGEQSGVVITLVSVFMLGAVLAMAALSVDVVTLYTARSEAQLAADAAALAGARVFANSGVTSDASRRTTRNAIRLATTVATQVATQNQVGGQPLKTTEVTVSFPNQTDPSFDTNPHITVTAQKTDLPSFFARVWGKTANTVTASATAEAYNPSDANALNGTTLPVAPLCVKPWLLPNMDPTGASTNPIFDRTTGAIYTTGFNNLVGKEWPSSIPANNQDGLYSLCSGDCSGGISAPAAGAYYPGVIDATDFPAPTQAIPPGSAGFNAYQLAVAGCVPQPISCNQTIKIDTTAYTANTGSRDSDTIAASSLLIHYVSAAGDADSIDTATTRPPLQFIAGNQNPLGAGIATQEIMVSDSLVTIPVIDYPSSNPPPTLANPSIQIIGFLQVFLNPQSINLPYNVSGITKSPNEIPATIINMAGCGIGASGAPIYGNGSSPVAVRLISATGA